MLERTCGGWVRGILLPRIALGGTLMRVWIAATAIALVLMGGLGAVIAVDLDAMRQAAETKATTAG